VTQIGNNGSLHQKLQYRLIKTVRDRMSRINDDDDGIAAISIDAADGSGSFVY